MRWCLKKSQCSVFRSFIPTVLVYIGIQLVQVYVHDVIRCIQHTASFVPPSVSLVSDSEDAGTESRTAATFALASDALTIRLDLVACVDPSF